MAADTGILDRIIQTTDDHATSPRFKGRCQRPVNNLSYLEYEFRDCRVKLKTQKKTGCNDATGLCGFGGLAGQRRQPASPKQRDRPGGSDTANLFDSALHNFLDLVGSADPLLAFILY